MGEGGRQSTQLVLRGGTNVPFSPQYEYIEHVLMPTLRRLGVQVSLSLNRRGCFPSGGGEVVVEVQGVEGSLPPLQMLERGEVKEIGGRVWSRGSRVPHSMCDDILSEFATGVSNAGELKDVGVEVVVSAAESESRGERGKDDACGLVVWAVTSTGCILGILFPCLPTACLHASIRAYLHCIALLFHCCRMWRGEQEECGGSVWCWRVHGGWRE